MTVTQGAWADELTVYDGAALCPYSPAYINYFDWYTRSQYIIPAANLEAMNGKIITALKYYSNTSNKTSTCNVDVYLKEVSYTTFNSTPTFETKSGIVYRGTVSIAGDGTLTITFTTPYTYNGGNLLIGMENTETDNLNLKYTSFYCQYVTGAVAFGTNSSSLAAVTATRGEFLPKTTFTYETPDPNAGLLTGRFSVSATKQVQFSQGNLQAYFASAGTSCTWRFATNQYDYVGSAAANVSINGNGSVSAAGAVDLFGWVGNSSTVLTGTPAKYGISNSTTASDYGTSTSDALKDDWGNQTITANGSATNLGWRTLTSAEWVYLFNTRTSGSTVNGTSNARFTHATINTDGTSVNGVILFPDGVTIANGEATSWGNVNSNSTWSGSTKCTSAQWTALAAKGCVFLPAAGRRRGATVYGCGLPGSDAYVPFGYYWSSSPNAEDQTKADHMYFYSDRVYPGNTGVRYDCMSVRLVKDYTFTGLGTEASPYLIASTTDWNNLVSAVNGGETYSGKYFKMTANVGTVSTWMTGTFSGTFDGDGKTLTVGYSSSANGCAPFGNLRAATIKNLIVDGTISTSGERAGGIAWWVLEGSMTYITNCRVAATINSTFSGGASTGGFVGSVQDYGTDGKLTITGCAFTGSLLGSSTNTCGGFVGWNGGTLTIENSLFAPASVTWGTTYSATFTRGGTVTNCYYTQKFGDVQGLQARTIAAGDYVSTLSVTKGSATATYAVSGITVYSGGIDFNDGSTTTFYGGSGQTVSLDLTAETRTGYQLKQYAASQGSLSGQTTNTPTLTMPAANSTANDVVTISAEYDPTYNADFADGNDNDGWDIDPEQQIEGGTVTVSYEGENKVKSVTVAPKGALTGKFSVSSTKQVQFSKGNLQYDGSAWSFHTNQYDCVFTSEGTATGYPMDIFCWGNIDAPAYDGKTGIGTNGVDLSGSSDWGSNTITNGCTGWRTLTWAEWEYLFANHSYGYATVAGQTGVIILPDVFTDPMRNNGSAAFAASTASWTANVYAAGDDWTAMEKAGALFLPAAGGRDGASIKSVGTKGSYWSSTADTVHGHFITFEAGSAPVTTYVSIHKYGKSVRLVKDVE
jgi:hypothetical protein